GSSVASTVLLGKLLVADMLKKGYSKQMSLGPILGSAGLATMIPPTTLGILLASIASIPVGKFLFAIIIPGIILSILFLIYIVVRSYLLPNLSPAYDLDKVTLSEKLFYSFYSIFLFNIILF